METLSGTTEPQERQNVGLEDLPEVAATTGVLVAKLGSLRLAAESSRLKEVHVSLLSRLAQEHDFPRREHPFESTSCGPSRGSSRQASDPFQEALFAILGEVTSLVQRLAAMGLEPEAAAVHTVKNDVEAWCQSLNKPIAVHLERSAPAAKTPRDTGMPRGSEAHQWTTTSERFHGASMNFSPSWQPLTRHDFIPRASSAVKDPNNPHVPKRLDSKPEGTQAELRPPSSRLYGTAAAHLAAAGDRALGKEVTRVATPWRPESDRWATPVRLRQAGTAMLRPSPDTPRSARDKGYFTHHLGSSRLGSYPPPTDARLATINWCCEDVPTAV